jgi:hypothetical protein
MKQYVGAGIDPHILDLGTSWMSVVSFTPLLLYLKGNATKTAESVASTALREGFSVSERVTSGHIYGERQFGAVA